MRLPEGGDRFDCPFCGRVHVPDAGEDGVRVLGGTAPERCPVCAAALIHAAIEGLRVLHCAACGGVLIGMPEFVTLVDHMRAAGPPPRPRPHDPLQLERAVSCPRCARPMNTHHYAGPGQIVIDSCSACMVNWLDRGELLRVVSAAQRSRDLPPIDR